LLFFYSVAEVGVSVKTIGVIAKTLLWGAAVAFYLFRRSSPDFGYLPWRAPLSAFFY